MYEAPREVAKIVGAVAGLAAVQAFWLIAWVMVILGATVGWLFVSAAWRAMFG